MLFLMKPTKTDAKTKTRRDLSKVCVIYLSNFSREKFTISNRFTVILEIGFKRVLSLSQGTFGIHVRLWIYEQFLHFVIIGVIAGMVQEGILSRFIFSFLTKKNNYESSQRTENVGRRAKLMQYIFYKSSISQNYYSVQRRREKHWSNIKIMYIRCKSEQNWAINFVVQDRYRHDIPWDKRLMILALRKHERMKQI